MDIRISITEGKRDCLTYNRMFHPHLLQNPCGQHDFGPGSGIVSVYISDGRRNMLFPFNRIAPAKQDAIDAGIMLGVNKADLAADTHICDIGILPQCLQL